MSFTVIDIEFYSVCTGWFLTDQRQQHAFQCDVARGYYVSFARHQSKTDVSYFNVKARKFIRTGYNCWNISRYAFFFTQPTDNFIIMIIKIQYLSKKKSISYFKLYRYIMPWIKKSQLINFHWEKINVDLSYQK